MKCLVSYISWFRIINNHINGEIPSLLTRQQVEHIQLLPAFIQISQLCNLLSSPGSQVLIKRAASEISPYQLDLTNVNSDFSGEYRCVAGNVLGETSASIILNISGAEANQSCLYLLVMVIIMASNIV